jgi:hypothetical protein
MGKKKKHSKHDTVSDDVFDMAASSIKKFRKVTNEIAKLSTGQKLVGGLALLAGGLIYWNKMKDEWADGSHNGFNFQLPKLAAATEPAAPEPEAPPAAEEKPHHRKHHKGTKTSKARSVTARKPAASPDDY